MLNIFNAERALNADEEKLEQARARRKIHVSRLTSIYKCLSILLDTDLVNFAILGDSFICQLMNRHPSHNDAEVNPLEHFLELVGGRPRSAGGEMSGNHYKVQVAKLRDLLGKCDEELRCFDDPTVTLPMEVALDKHLSDRARVSSESTNLEDIHLILSYLGDVRPGESDN